ncbi:hypothetical protein COY27_02400 [Candidatus Woesearchaeota archaeon CG_4_10_14_0_2_um_filter_33_13]|nr:MAG: hypothetical protein COY27_02400 [Candidatus Woesearchaeota archaeon CG_4_10_14_0_2_um_filter_33_13]
MSTPLNIAINMDFDYTCTRPPIFHQDPFLEQLGINSADFWNKVSTTQRAYEQRSIGRENFSVMYLTLFQREVEAKLGRPLTRADLLEAGRLLKKEHLFPGLPEFWNNIKEGFPNDNLEVRIISVGIKPILQACPIVGPYVDIIAAYDFLTEDGSDTGRIIGPACTVSSGEKENVVVALSYGKSFRGNLRDGQQVYDFPLRQTIIIADGFSDRAMCQLGKKYGAATIGIAADQGAIVKAGRELGYYFDEFHVGDYRPGSSLLQSIETKIKSFHDNN